MHIKNGAVDSTVTAQTWSSPGSADRSDQHELLVAAAKAVLSTLESPIARETLPRPALAALRMLGTVLANERPAGG